MAPSVARVLARLMRLIGAETDEQKGCVVVARNQKTLDKSRKLFKDWGLSPHTHYIARVSLYSGNVAHHAIVYTGVGPDKTMMVLNGTYDNGVARVYLSDFAEFEPIEILDLGTTPGVKAFGQVHELDESDQYYKGILLNIIPSSYHGSKAKRFIINKTNQNLWIPNKHLTDSGLIKDGEDLDYVFRQATRKLEIAGYTDAIVGIKRRTVCD